MGKKKNRRRFGNEFDSFVEHPRYGRHPQITGLNPKPDFDTRVFLHWASPADQRIENTAIVADLQRQSPATIPVTHYFDVKRVCRDCNSPFLFFAQEQQHWYEDLEFPLESDCVRCSPCRKMQQGLVQKQARYEELFHLAQRTFDEDLEMAECCISLMEASLFGHKQIPRVRMILKNSKPLLTPANATVHETLLSRLVSIEEKPDRDIG
ncbi:MAG: hypothetical protein GKR97_19405 [Rhizobiaceae bacterium]|nr:hypothetical protein [Rhizobiaceae bacterium]